MPELSIVVPLGARGGEGREGGAEEDLTIGDES